MTWLALGLFAKRVGTGVITWLTHASFWQLVCIALALFATIQTVRVKAEQRHSGKVETQLSKCTQHGKELQGQLDSISSKRDVQRQVTRDRLVTVTRVIKEADGRAEKVESAPLPGGCRTPQAVLDADV